MRFEMQDNRKGFEFEIVMAKVWNSVHVRDQIGHRDIGFGFGKKLDVYIVVNKPTLMLCSIVRNFVSMNRTGSKSIGLGS